MKESTLKAIQSEAYERGQRDLKEKISKRLADYMARNPGKIGDREAHVIMNGNFS